MRLRTFGGLWIEGEQPPAALGPRRMGLLALVAAAGPRGISRERAMGILWPEAEQELARHTLSQTLYSLKRDTGRDWIVAGSELRLDPAIGSDVGELLNALASGDHEAAAGLYSGAFLEGFYIPGAPEFERWVEDERARLRDAVIRVAEQAAAQADHKGDHTAAIRVWTRLTELDPLSARYAAGRMRSLTEVGDRASALDHARRHEALVRRELDADVDPAIRKLVLNLKAERAIPSAPVVLSRASAPGRGDAAQEPEAAPAPLRAQPVPESPQSRRALRIVAPLLGVALLLLVGMIVLKPGKSRDMPFLAVGLLRTPELGDTSSLGPILRDMLATSLGGVEGLQVVANSRLVELMPRGSGTTGGMMNDAARRAGATEVVEGELSAESAGLVLSIRRVTLESGIVRKGYLVRAADRYAIVDSATAAIARDLQLMPPSLTVAEVRTSTPGAYALYDEGLRAHYGYDAPAAYRLMSAALARDSTFVMAAWYVWWLSRSMAMPESTTTRTLYQIQRLAPRTIERERLLIQASVAEVVAPLQVAVAIAETLTVKYPTDPDGQLQLGLAREKQGDWSGAVDAYQRAFVLDSLAGALSGPYCRVCQTLGLMARAYLWWDSAAAGERVVRKLNALRPNEHPTAGNLVEFLARQGRRAEAEAVHMEMAISRADAARSYFLDRDLLRWGRYETADHDLAGLLTNPNREIRNDAKWLLLLSLRDQGRLREAHALMQGRQAAGLPGLTAESGPMPVDLAMLGLEMGRPALTIRTHRENVTRAARSADPAALRSRTLSWNLTLAGTAHAAAGDTAVVRRLADSLEIIGHTSNWARDTRLHHVLRGLLLQLEGKHGQAVEAFRRSLFSLTDGYTRTNLMLAQSLLALGRGAEAVAILQPAIRGGVDGSNTYVSRTELHEALATAFEQAGRRDSAVAHWRAVESAWRRADPPFRERYLAARRNAGL